MSHIRTVRDQTILRVNNVRSFRAEFTRDYLQDLVVERMDWPTSSPDLSPIESLVVFIPE